MASTPVKSNSKQSVEQSLDELSALLGETLRGLKRSSPPPAEVREAAEGGSLGPRHMPALLAVATAGPMSVTELARRLGLGLSTTSAIVGELARAGLLERAEDERDHRRTIVRLPAEHSEAVAGWARRALAPVRATLERLSPGARAQFLEGWRILHEEVTRAASRRAGDARP